MFKHTTEDEKIINLNANTALEASVLKKNVLKIIELAPFVTREVDNRKEKENDPRSRK
jgi:hypothetical protein